MDYKTFMLLTLFVFLLIKLISEVVSWYRKKKPSEEFWAIIRQYEQWVPSNGPALLYSVEELLDRVFKSDEPVSYYDMTVLIIILLIGDKPWSSPQLAYQLLKELSENGDETKADPYWVFLFGLMTKYGPGGFPHDPVLGDYLVKVAKCKMEEKPDAINEN